MVGEVHSGGDATLRIRLRGQKHSQSDFEVVVDTGFNDWLTLSAEAIDMLGLRWREQMTYSLADGSTVTVNIFEAKMEGFGRWRRVFVSELEGGPLLGMAALHGSRLIVDVIDGGSVSIEPLPAS